ncbi:MAG: GlsB/YeaQ/YmgE family stress response membrane protein [Acidimicrobiales bacterium]
MAVVAWVVVGFVAGVVARAVIHTRRHVGCLGTIVLGILGSLVGGVLGAVARGDGVELGRSGIIGSVLGAVVILAVVRFVDSD